MNAIQPLAELEAQQFPLVQSCAFQKMVSPFDDVRKASAEAERRIDAHLLMCRCFILLLFLLQLCILELYVCVERERERVPNVRVLENQNCNQGKQRGSN